MVDDEARPWEPLFTTKPERFTEILLNQDDAARAREYERVQDLLFGEIVRFGFLNHPEQWPPLAALYRSFSITSYRSKRDGRYTAMWLAWWKIAKS